MSQLRVEQDSAHDRTQRYFTDRGLGSRDHVQLPTPCRIRLECRGKRKHTAIGVVGWFRHQEREHHESDRKNAAKSMDILRTVRAVLLHCCKLPVLLKVFAVHSFIHSYIHAFTRSKRITRKLKIARVDVCRCLFWISRGCQFEIKVFKKSPRSYCFVSGYPLSARQAAENGRNRGKDLLNLFYRCHRCDHNRHPVHCAYSRHSNGNLSSIDSVIKWIKVFSCYWFIVMRFEKLGNPGL